MSQSDSLSIHGAQLSRRAVLGAGGGLAVTLALKPDLAGAAAAAPAGGRDPTRPASWIEIHADNTVQIMTGKCDFGQSSIYTAYRQIVAEELGVPLSAMTAVVSGDTDRTPEGGGTFGLLRGVQGLRKVAAYTREAALELAARRFGVDRAKVTLKDGVFSGGGKSATYGELVRGQDFILSIPVSGDIASPFGLTVDGSPPFKPVSEYVVIGQPAPNPTTRPKMAGETVWVGDVKLPGMWHARTIHPATLGSRLVSPGKLDQARFPGAKVVVLGNLLAVVSPNEWEAVQAAQQVAGDTKWSEWKGLPPSDRLFDHLRQSVDWKQLPARKGRAEKGDPAKATAVKVHQASYGMPYLKHAPISPVVSVGDVKPDGSVVLHTATQNPQPLRNMIAMMLSCPKSQVVIRTYPGTGHYGRSNGGCAGSEDEAVLLSRALGHPVRVQWMRADDMQWSTQSTASMSDIRIALDDAGRISSYQAQHHGPPLQDDRLVGGVLAGLPVIDAPLAPAKGAGMLDASYLLNNIMDAWVYDAIPAIGEEGLTTYQLGEKQSPLALGLRGHSMRTPIQFQQNFPRELAISEAAMLAGKDPLQFRIDHVGPRFKAVLERARTESGWETRPSTPERTLKAAAPLRGQGVSIMLRDDGYWACVAMVSVKPSTGELKVDRITMVADLGIVVNPLQLRRQIQAGCLMGVSQALYEETTFDESGVTCADWASYPIMTMEQMPEVKVVIASMAGADDYGQGSESANALAAPAIAGAILDATGKAPRHTPFRPDRLRALLQA